MRLADSLRAREPRASAHSIVLIMGVSTVVLALLTTFGPNSVSSATRAASWVGVAALVAATALCVLVPVERLDRAGAFVLIGVGGVLLTCVLDVLTDDPSAGAQAFLAFPVLWAASHLRWAAVALVTAAAVVGDGITQLVLQPLEPAAHDSLVVGTVLVVASVILTRAASVQDRLVSALQQQAHVDPLTGLVTRRVLDDALTGALERDPTGAGTALVLLDIDSFKQINDAHGHPVGDDALVHLSGLVRRQVRAGDAVVGRLGGDELALLLPGCTAATAARRAGELVETVRASPLPRADGGALPLSISVGVAHAPLHAASVRELYAAADAALYQAKRAGRDRVEVAVSPVPGPADELSRQRSAP
ncbi:GGDEF domain-containing protein [Geodermatophilus sp. URMC 61]|uniref:GGDEF domain-containing protein n=1 Tax=Geodermatophilus sp. URMC 61 TaxID=3423411 RepID=UPI00406CEDD8